MNLDDVYKSRLAESHAAGLQAVFEAGVAAGKEAAAGALHTIITPTTTSEGEVQVGDA